MWKFRLPYKFRCNFWRIPMSSTIARALRTWKPKYSDCSLEIYGTVSLQVLMRIPESERRGLPRSWFCWVSLTLDCLALSKDARQNWWDSDWLNWRKRVVLLCTHPINFVSGCEATCNMNKILRNYQTDGFKWWSTRVCHRTHKISLAGCRCWPQLCPNSHQIENWFGQSLRSLFGWVNS